MLQPSGYLVSQSKNYKKIVNIYDLTEKKQIINVPQNYSQWDSNSQSCNEKYDMLSICYCGWVNIVKKKYSTFPLS